MEKPNNYSLQVRASLTFAFVVMAPFTTFILLTLKGLPTFAISHVEQVLIWVYGVTWIPALLSGLLLSAIVSNLLNQTDYFHRPYDFGRCFSLGAITGALTEALATGRYRWVSHRPISGFWIAGAMIAGCLAGAFITPLVLWRFSRSR